MTTTIDDVASDDDIRHLAETLTIAERMAMLEEGLLFVGDVLENAPSDLLGVSTLELESLRVRLARVPMYTPLTRRASWLLDQLKPARVTAEGMAVSAVRANGTVGSHEVVAGQQSGCTVRHTTERERRQLIGDIKEPSFYVMLAETLPGGAYIEVKSRDGRAATTRAMYRGNSGAVEQRGVDGFIVAGTRAFTFTVHAPAWSPGNISADTPKVHKAIGVLCAARLLGARLHIVARRELRTDLYGSGDPQVVRFSCEYGVRFVAPSAANITFQGAAFIPRVAVPNALCMDELHALGFSDAANTAVLVLFPQGFLRLRELDAVGEGRRGFSMSASVIHGDDDLNEYEPPP